MFARYRLFGITTAIIVLLDQLSKIYIEQNFFQHESVSIVENFLDITSVRNPGAAFGILADSSIREPFFIIVSIVAGIAILWYLHSLKEDQKTLAFPLCMIFAGAMGNLIDRIRIGKVIDFIDIHWFHHHWPAFNIADSAISVGVALLLFHMWKQEKKNVNK